MSAQNADHGAPVRLARASAILVVTIDNAPVNALGVAVRADPGGHRAGMPIQRRAILMWAGRNFIGGADIREFGKPPQAPLLTDVCKRIEACSKPVLAAIHGAALGGGLEVALAAHYRLACRRALGLPEVQLGLLPGAGGTQRAPRLIGAQAARWS
jgi:3-hydroxyacyl-CoA dehydrogenase